MPAVSSDFIARWHNSGGAERANYQQFFTEFCAFLGVDAPDPQRREDYCFEKPVKVLRGDGSSSPQRIDLYKRGHFIFEAKQGSDAAGQGMARRGTAGWQKAMRAAFVQAVTYAHHLQERPPFLITCDIGHVFEVWTGFSRPYGDYNARRTIPFEQLQRPEIADWFRAVFTDPASVDPARIAARVTREVAADLAGLARGLEAGGHAPEAVSAFLMRLIFTMFAEDVHLIDDEVFTGSLERVWLPHPERFVAGLGALWEAMDKGKPFGAHQLLRFNGGLFQRREVLPLNGAQLAQLLAAARRDWSFVEPSIFGTLLERALSETQRNALGAHFTPRAYIERLVRRAVIDPIRERWRAVQAAVLKALDNGEQEPTKAQTKRAVKLLEDFHHWLRGLKILDPSCGTGNFLYVTFDLMKEIEAEVERALRDLDVRQLGMEHLAVVNPSQFLGLEINPRAREIADLVLWLGYLKWYRQARGKAHPPEPILRSYKNIQRLDAVLRHEARVPRLDKNGQPVRVHDLQTFVRSPLTGEQVPDTVNGMVQVFDYPQAAAQAWPEADFIVSNPPFIGNKQMRMDLGDGYAEAIRKAYPEVSGAVDYVMYWWEKAAALVAAGKVQRFGFITTNSILQVQNRSVIERHLESGKVAIPWAVADHPWVEAGAAVRIAMTVGAPAAEVRGGELGEVIEEQRGAGEVEGQAREVKIGYRRVAAIHADLTGGANVAGAKPLRANQGVSFMGVTLVGEGFRLTPEEVQEAGYRLDALPPVLKPYMNARDLTQGGSPRYVIDLYGLTAEQARERYPTLYQRLLERVKPEREQNKRDSYRKNWWIFGESRGAMRTALDSLSQYIITPITSKHRFFVLVPDTLLSDCQLHVVAMEAPWALGVLSSHIHTVYSLAAGSWLGVGNDPRWRNGPCFDPFPFPDATPEQQAEIGTLAERLDAHRKRVQAAHPDAFLTAQYNALERRRALLAGKGDPLTEKERAFHQRALIGLLDEIHQQLDAAVAAAYGWPAQMEEAEILERVVALNAQRAAEEAAGTVRYLRPGLQDPKAAPQAALLRPAAPPVEADTLPTWPDDPIQQILAARQAMARRAQWTARELQRQFQKAPLAEVQQILSSLGQLGVLIQSGEAWQVR